MPPGSVRVPERGDVYHVDPQGAVGREMKDPHNYLIVSPVEINRLGVALAVPITTGGEGQRKAGTTMNITGGGAVTGVAVCNQVRPLDIQARVRAGNARFVERIDRRIADYAASVAASCIDPSP